MPSLSGKVTRTNRTTKKPTTAKKAKTTATPKVVTKTKPTVVKTASASKKPTTSERVVTLEEKVDKLLSILDSEFRSELRQGPKALSNKLRNAGLIK